eukprot:m.263498 g.263498  ORF g.263498 m.263498 type:complete len:72 (+) comp17612_c0_seq51:1975-2190(+)
MALYQRLGLVHRLILTSPQAPSTKSLFEIVLKRLDEDFESLKLPSGDPSVEAVMVSLCCARHGLSENDLQV